LVLAKDKVTHWPTFTDLLINVTTEP